MLSKKHTCHTEIYRLGVTSFHSHPGKVSPDETKVANISSSPQPSSALQKTEEAAHLSTSAAHFAQHRLQEWCANMSISWRVLNCVCILIKSSERCPLSTWMVWVLRLKRYLRSTIWGFYRFWSFAGYSPRMSHFNSVQCDFYLAFEER